MTTESTDTRSSNAPGARNKVAAAATITVIGGGLVVNGAPAGAVSVEVTNLDASGPGSFAQAVIDANAAPGADEITFASGLEGTIELDDTVEIRDGLAIVGPGDGSITLSHPNGDVLYVYNTSFSISGLTIADADEAIEFDGILLDAHSVSIDNVEFVDVNRGIEVDNAGPVTVTSTSFSGVNRSIDIVQVVGDVLITDVEATTGSDQFFYSDRVYVRDVEGSVAISDSSFASSLWTRRISDDGSETTGNLSITDVTIDALYGGLRTSNVAGDIEVSNVTVSGENSASADFRGVYSLGPIVGDQRLTVDGLSVSTVEEGRVRISVRRFDSVAITNTEAAGSISISDVTEGTVSNSTFRDGRGGYIGFFKDDEAIDAESDSFERDGFVVSVDDSTVTMSQVTVAGHETGAVLGLDDADVTLVHSTFANNTVSGPVVAVTEPYLGGPYVPIAVAESEPSSTLTLDHTVLGDAPGDGFEFADRTRFGGGIKLAAESEAVDFALDGTYSLVPDAVATDYGLDDTNIETDDPRIGPLDDSVGTLPTASPLAGSPAVDAGEASIADAPEFDQRGEARIVDVIDIGAVESTALLVSVDPARFADTRDSGETIDGEYEGEGRRTDGSTYTVQIAGRGDVPEGATAVVMNLTAVAPDGVGFVTVFSCDDEQPNASSLNFSSSNVGNEIITGLADDGTVCLFVQGSAHLTVDVVAYADELSALTPVTPGRVYESRTGQSTVDGRFQGAGALGAGTQRTIPIAGRNGVPADAAAVIVNVTAIRPTDDGFMTVHACLPTLPNTSSLNFEAGTVRATEVVAQLNEFGELCVFSSAATDLAVDVVGYLPVGSIETVDPSRLLDTRTAGSTIDGVAEGDGTVAADGVVTLPVGGRAGVPEGVKAVVVNVTAIRPEARGFVTVDGCATPRPTASSLNYEPGVNTPNEIIAGVNADGEICLYTSAATDLAVDVVAFIR